MRSRPPGSYRVREGLATSVAVAVMLFVVAAAAVSMVHRTPRPVSLALAGARARPSVSGITGRVSVPVWLALRRSRHASSFVVSSSSSLPSSSAATAAATTAAVATAEGAGPPSVSTPSSSGKDLISQHYDLIIIGGGPTGCAAAEKAAYGGLKAMVVDDPGKGKKLQLGGPTGLFSKALRDTAKRVDVKILRAMGMSERSIWAQVQDMCKEVALVETQNTVKRLRGISVPRLQGKAKFSGPATVDLYLRNGQKVPVHADNFLIATGSSAYQDPSIPFDDRRVFDSDTIKDLSYLPKKVAITGAGIIAIEYAKIFARLEADVTLVIRDTSFPAAMQRVGVDVEIAETLMEDLISSGVRLVFGQQVGNFSVPPSLCKEMTIDLVDAKTKQPNGHTLSVDTYMFAAGRVPNTERLGLDEAGVMIDDKKRVLVDDNLETSVKGVYAAGDVLGPPGLASTGIEQGAGAVGSMLAEREGGGVEERGGGKFDPKSYLGDPNRFPVGIWTTPEVAYIGLTKAKAEEMGINAVEGKGYYSDTTRGRVSRANGFLKMVVDAGKRDLPVIGVSIIGEDACELIHYGMNLVQAKRSMLSVLEATHAAVTYHELYKVAAASIDAKLEFGVKMRSCFDLEFLQTAKSKFQEVLQIRHAEGLNDNEDEEEHVLPASSDCEPQLAKIPYSDVVDIAVDLCLMTPDADDGVGGADMTYADYLEFLRQVRRGHARGASVGGRQMATTG
eukprot:CAMPEP_0197518894 /NCGR_PEP_ID=MMETSP1318-20131121/4156_1 /TAXON_ID=552666 /ORGANISM="Partenskyella glossopodia, Strain RCC365" /LENGTH=730 /DNA_ID=CAMNT_0043069579 /DNA_START=49 /DNA_END=2241 /DNA_ORIENTATION=-